MADRQIAGTTAATLTKGLGQLYIPTMETLAKSGEPDWKTALARMRGGLKAEAA